MGCPAALRNVDGRSSFSFLTYDHFVHQNVHLCQNGPLAVSAAWWAAYLGRSVNLSIQGVCEHLNNRGCILSTIVKVVTYYLELLPQVFNRQPYSSNQNIN